MDFIKMHGLGNDFIMVDESAVEGLNLHALALRLCDRHTGIGADGLVVICKSDIADVRMRIFNADGSEAEMCGNASRCFAKYVYERGIIKGDEFGVETPAGIIVCKVNAEAGKVQSVTVDVGAPLLDCSDIPALGEGRFVLRELDVCGEKLNATAMFMGVPHCVIFENAVDVARVESVGPVVEHLPLFPRGTNVNFAHVTDPENIELATWERGCGRTLACGTGSCATAIAGVLCGRTKRRVNIHLALGVLAIEWKENGRVYMTGPAAISFVGRVEL